MLGLVVSVDGYRTLDELHEGNKFEGHTMLPIIDAFKTKYKLVIGADSGLLSTANINDLQEKGCNFILGTRIKNENKAVKEKILSLNPHYSSAKESDIKICGVLSLTVGFSKTCVKF